MMKANTIIRKIHFTKHFEFYQKNIGNIISDKYVKELISIRILLKRLKMMTLKNFKKYHHKIWLILMMQFLHP